MNSSNTISNPTSQAQSAPSFERPTGKRAYREAKRIAPLGLRGLIKCREIVKTCTGTKINEVFVDLFSASAIVQVYDAVNSTNQAKLLTMPVARVADVCFKVSK